MLHHMQVGVKGKAASVEWPIFSWIGNPTYVGWPINYIGASTATLLVSS